MDERELLRTWIFQEPERVIDILLDMPSAQRGDIWAEARTAVEPLVDQMETNAVTARTDFDALHSPPPRRPRPPRGAPRA